MFEIIVKDFVHGTKLEVVTSDRYVEIINSWINGGDIMIAGVEIKHKNIESIYSRLK
ncbi:hypothetical protein D3C87_77270 [compost metagenome]